MGNPFFRFKQFVVYHDRCAMKVGTDGVLLGAWCDVDGVTSILDVGAGSGLIALMAAQRNRQARVTAIEIDSLAAGQAADNIHGSPFADRVNVLPVSFQKFAETRLDRYGLIVSNPPFFTDSLLSPDTRRTSARHSVDLSLDELLFLSLECLMPDGVISLILPYAKMEELVLLARRCHLFVKRLTRVHPLRGNPPRRILVELTPKKVTHPVVDDLAIEMEGHCYTPEFSALVKDFYL